MAVQTRLDIDLTPFILGGQADQEYNAVLLQDAGRGSAVLAFGTLLAKIAATGKYVPFTDETATDGTANPSAIYIGPEIPGADIVAGDIENLHILIGSACYVDQNKIVIENSKLLTTIIGVTSVNSRTVKDQLRLQGILPVDSVDTTSFEN
jgi:hypothetical protein